MPASAEGKAINPTQLFDAPFALVSHGTQDIPIFNYGNRAALALFELSWQEFTQLPSYKSAEAVSQSERDRLLLEVSQNGFIDNYQGIRISASGKRFKIEDAIVWNLVDSSNAHIGQAALLTRWTFLRSSE